MYYINDSSKNLGTTDADKTDSIKECRRQLYNSMTYKKNSKEAKNELTGKIKIQLKRIVEKHLQKGSLLPLI